MSDEEGNADYMFGYDFRASARLDLQHFLIKQQIGHLVHPEIALPSADCKIADIGAGTCIWSVECARHIQTPVHFDCFDVTPAQYPPREWLPENISLHLHDAFQPFPSEFHGRYDLVHVRCFVCIVKDNDPSTLIGNLVALLRSGGCIQWVEPDPQSLRVIQPTDQSKSSESMRKIYDFMALPLKDISFGWVAQLGAQFAQAGLTDIKMESHPISPILESFHNILKLLTCEEAISLSKDSTSERSKQLKDDLGKAYNEMRRNGAGLTSGFILALARRPLEAKDM